MNRVDQVLLFLKHALTTGYVPSQISKIYKILVDNMPSDEKIIKFRNDNPKMFSRSQFPSKELLPIPPDTKIVHSVGSFVHLVSTLPVSIDEKLEYLKGEWCKIAVENENLDILIMGDESNLSMYNASKIAFKRGFRPALEYMAKQRRICDSVIDGAIDSDQIDVVKMIFDKGSDYMLAACSAAGSGKLEILKLLYEKYRNQTNWDYEVCEFAASCGYLECLKYAHEVCGCGFSKISWDGKSTPVVCLSAASRGDLACLKYAHEHGAEWDVNVAIGAFPEHMDCVMYALENGCPTKTDNPPPGWDRFIRNFNASKKVPEDEDKTLYTWEEFLELQKKNKQKPVS